MLAFPHSVSFYCPNVSLDLIFLIRICKKYYRKLEEMLSFSEKYKNIHLEP